jgi:adenylate cyclase
MAEERVQRRLAAILAADVVGYSRLTGTDEAGTRARFNNQFDEVVRPAIADHRGRLVKTMGDGFLLEFGSVIDAVQCATDIQKAVELRQSGEPDDRKMLFRMGIHLGDVIVEGDDIHGDGVNIAARLEGLAQPGGIFISDMVHAGVRNKLSLDFIDLGEQSLKNIADPVKVFQIALDRIVGGGTTSSDAIFRRPAVAVLPFQNMSGDPEQEYFADGLTEDIITALSLWKSFPVIARNSTFAYKGKSPDMREVGKALGARYVLEGSVRKAGKRVRVTVQLINTETGHHVWAEKYDRELEDIFALQDEITHQIAAIIEPAIARAERHRILAKPPNDVDAWEYLVRGYALIYEITKESTAKARVLFQRAIDLDPQYARAYSALAHTHGRDLRFRWADSMEDSLKLLFENARRAIALDETDSEARTMLVRAYHVSDEPEASIAESRRAVELNPNNAFALQILGASLSVIAARYEEGIPWIERALELDPLDPQKHLYLTHLAIAHLCAGHYEKAVDFAKQALRQQPDFLESRITLASALGYLGREAEARLALEDRENLARRFVKEEPRWAQETKQRVLDGLSKAGLPE